MGMAWLRLTIVKELDLKPVEMEQILWKNSRALFHLDGESRRTEILRSAQDDNPASASFDSQHVLFEMYWGQGPWRGFRGTLSGDSVKGPPESLSPFAPKGAH